MADVDTIMARLHADAQARFVCAMPVRAPFVARSASDKTDDWPFWLVADRNGMNVTAQLAEMQGEVIGRFPLVRESTAKRIEANANG